MGSVISSYIKDETRLKERVPDQEIWFSLLNSYPKTYTLISNPLRVDKTPSAQFVVGFGKILLHDFRDRETIDSITAYQRKYGVSRQKAIDIINGEISTPKITLENKYTLDKTPKTSSWIYKIQKGNWTKERLKYWEDYGIDKDTMKELQIKYVVKAWGRKSNSNDFRLVGENIFAYQFEDRYKLYNPFTDDKFLKWKSNTNSSDIFGRSSLKGYDKKMITSSGKDVASLRSLFKRHSILIDVEAPQSEAHLLKNETYDYIWYDNDKAGKEYAAKHNEIYQGMIINQPEYKDPSEWIKAEGDEPIMKFISSWLK